MTILSSTEGQRNLPTYFPVIWGLISSIKVGVIEIALPDGRVFRSEAPEAGPYGRIDVVNPSMFRRMVRDGEMGFPESYMDGWWDTPDLQALLDVVLMNNDQVGRRMPGAELVRLFERIRHWLRSNSRSQAQKNISYHYDLGNDFYEEWLDESMTYSSALFDRPGMSLTEAQHRKYERICDEIGVKQGDRILEIGCGWGGFAEYAARNRGAHVTGLTISQKQHEFALRRAQEAGIEDRVEVKLQDYRDERGSYDGIVSIEMFEAVGEKYWPAYFETVKRCLKPGSRACLQIITIADKYFASYRKKVDFIQKYIFPGGMLPSPGALRQEVADAGMNWLNSFEFADSYSQTLRIWHDSFNAKWVDISRLGFDDRFRRMWNLYLTSCAAVFAAKTSDVTQLTISRN